MANAIFDKAVEQADLIDTWATGKYRFYAVDMADAGPSAGAWVVAPNPTNVVLSSTAARNEYEYTFTTGAAHGLAAGEKVALFGFTGSPPAWAANTAMKLGDFRRATTSNGRKFRCIEPGTTAGAEPSWPTGDRLQIDGNLVWQGVGAEGAPLLNDNWVVFSVPSTTTFTIRTSLNFTYVTSGGYVANLNKTFLSEFAPAAARTAMSAPLTGKTVFAGPVLDCSDSSLDLTVADASEAILLVKVAALDADPDLADTAQRIIAYYDTMPGLPFAANAGIVALPISNTADRLLRL